ncbi:hypothetical protein BD769DRAFT_1383689 [Suillus cothurnatus]|nr:hypothetical protein BD769DRAFT_1383689 [Suillus cothurnatus]
MILGTLFMANYPAAGVVASIVVLAVLYKKISLMNDKNAISLPPGPHARWFWSKHFVFRQYCLCTDRSSLGAITTIMEAEGRSLVDCPLSIAAGEMLSNEMRIVLARSGEHFRHLSKAVHTHIQPKAAEVHKDMQHDNARSMIFSICHSLGDLWEVYTNCLH